MNLKHTLITILATTISISSMASMDVIDMSLDELNDQLKASPETILLDIRDPRELRLTGTIDHPKAYNLSRGWLETRIADVVSNKDTPIVVYCGQNIRSPMAAKTLMDMGYTDVKNFDEGFFEWKNAGQKVWKFKNQTSPLYELPIKITDNVYTAIGATQPASYENYGHNNNLSFIIGDDGVLVFNAGGSYTVAKALHEEIKKITDKPIKYVVYENAQFHAVFGSPYWKELGAKIIAQENFKTGNPDVTQATAKKQLKDHFFKSGVITPDIYYKDHFKVPLKGVNIELKYFGAAHGHEDALLWMPDQKLLITGDFAFNERLFPVFDSTDINSWIESWAEMEKLNPTHIIPGHGHPTDMATITKYTMGYAKHLKNSIEYLLDEDGGLSDIYNVDSSKFRSFGLFKELNNLNLEKIYKKFEFEY